MPLLPQTGREYLRVSIDRSGRARSVDEQHNDNERAAKERDVTLGAPYKDNSVSASRYGTKTRDGFAKLLADLHAGRFGADQLWLWEPSRGSRQVGEWDELIKACEKAAVAIHVTTHGRTYDPANGRDRRTLQEDAVDSEYESSKVSLRAKRAAMANAAAGLPSGRTPYGYRRIYDQHTKRLIRQEPHPEESKVIQELYARLLQGHSLRSIAADFAQRGIRTREQQRDGEPVAGKPFGASHLRDLALTPAYVGLRVHNPKTDGLRVRHELEGAVKGVWEPLVSEETYYDVRRMLSRPERKTSRPGRGVHLLSMIAKCAECDGPLAVTRRAEGGGTARVEQYQCHRKGCVRVNKADLDAVCEHTMLDYLAGKENYAPLASASAEGDHGLQRIRGQLAVAKAEQAAAERAEPRDVAHAKMLANLLRNKMAKVEALAEEERALSMPSELARLIDPDGDVRQQWNNMPMPTRRTLARTVLVQEGLGELCVERRPRDAGPRHIPADQRIQWRRPDASKETV